MNQADPLMGSGQAIDYHGVRFTRTELALLDENTPVVTIPLADVTALSLQYGLTAQRPFLGIVLAIPCVALGSLAVRRFVVWLGQGGVIWDVELLMSFFLVVGFVFLRSALKRGYYLLAQTQSSSRKLSFEGPLDERLPTIMTEAEKLVGRAIDWRSNIRSSA